MVESSLRLSKITTAMSDPLFLQMLQMKRFPSDWKNGDLIKLSKEDLEHFKNRRDIMLL